MDQRARDAIGVGWWQQSGRDSGVAGASAVQGSGGSCSGWCWAAGLLPMEGRGLVFAARPGGEWITSRPSRAPEAGPTGSGGAADDCMWSTGGLSPQKYK
jgi:hypothetical protein